MRGEKEEEDEGGGKEEASGRGTAPVGSTEPLAGPAVPGPNVNKHGPGRVSCSLSGGF